MGAFAQLHYLCIPGSDVWRFARSISYKDDIHLGPYEKRIEDIIFNDAEIPEEIDGFVTCVFTQIPGQENHTRSPVSFRAGSNKLNLVWFYLAGYRFIVKFDKRKFLEIPQSHTLRLSKNSIFFLEPWEAGPEEEVVRNLATQQHPAHRFLMRKILAKDGKN